MPMKPEQLAEIEARANAATDGPWVLGSSGNVPDISYYGSGWAGVTKDEKFIAHSRTDIPALIAEVRRLQEKLDIAVDALVTIEFRRGVTIFIEEPEHVEDFFKPVREALAKVRGEESK